MSDTPVIFVETISREAFARYGDVLVSPPDFGRIYFDQGLTNARPDAFPSISVSKIAETISIPITAIEMERHEFSSQTFIPMDVSRYLIVVAPHASHGGPDTERASAFVVPGNVGITYGVNVWHHPITVLDRSGIFAVQMWRNGSTTDEEFVKLEQPFQVDFSHSK